MDMGQAQREAKEKLKRELRERKIRKKSRGGKSNWRNMQGKKRIEWQKRSLLVDFFRAMHGPLVIQRLRVTGPRDIKLSRHTQIYTAPLCLND